MNTIIDLMRSPLLFLGYFALATPIGMLGYWGIFLARGKLQSNFLTGAIIVAIIPGFIFLGYAPLVGLLCLLPATLERRLDNNRAPWKDSFWLIALATHLSLVVGWLLEMATELAFLSPRNSYIPAIGLMLGFVLTPPSISVLRYVWHTSKVRPGFDVALRND